jgi:hypothetical protein
LFKKGDISVKSKKGSEKPGPGVWEPAIKSGRFCEMKKEAGNSELCNLLET